MSYVYILSCYDEHGAEDATATLDRSRLPDMLKENWPEPTEVDWSSPKPHWRQEYHKKWIEDALQALTELLKITDEELAVDRTCGHNLHTGWGGIQLHVLQLR